MGWGEIGVPQAFDRVMSARRPYQLHRRLERLRREPGLTPLRLRRLPLRRVLGREVPVAVGLRVRLLGLARLDRAAAGPGLLILRCAAVHTFGMRFALDVYFLGEDGEPLSVRRAVPPRRFVSHRGARAVLELPA